MRHIKSYKKFEAIDLPPMSDADMLRMDRERPAVVQKYTQPSANFKKMSGGGDKFIPPMAMADLENLRGDKSLNDEILPVDGVRVAGKQYGEMFVGKVGIRKKALYGEGGMWQETTTETLKNLKQGISQECGFVTKGASPYQNARLLLEFLKINQKGFDPYAGGFVHRVVGSYGHPANPTYIYMTTFIYFDKVRK